MKDIKERHIKQYRIMVGVEHESLFEPTVENKLKKGWELYGNPFYSSKHDSICQAIVKRWSNNEEDDK